MTQSISQNPVQLTGDITDTTYGAAVATGSGVTFSAQCVIDVNTPGAKTFTAPGAISILNNTVTIVGHGFTTGLKGQLTTTDTLPGGLSTSTDYFVIVVDDDTIAFAASLALAQAGTKIDITTTGNDASVNTFTPTAIAGSSVKLQKSNDKINWNDEGNATNITADATVWLEKVDPAGLWMRLAFAITAGRLSATNTIVVKG